MNTQILSRLNQAETSELSEKLCPVCGYDDLLFPPRDYMICPCCGTEFGYTDFTASHQELRIQWVQSGYRWFSKRTLPPEDWNPQLQLENAGFALNQYDIAMNSSEALLVMGPVVVASAYTTVHATKILTSVISLFRKGEAERTFESVKSTDSINQITAVGTTVKGAQLCPS